VTITCTIGGNPVLVANDASYSLADALENRAILTVTILDALGTANYQRGQPITYVDTVAGVNYNGYVSSSAPTKLGIAGPFVAHVITTMDKQYLLDKRTNSKNYLGWYAGDIVTDFIDSTLANEGVSAPYGTHRDSTAANFNQGLLAGLAGVSNVGDGDLEPTLAGIPVTITEPSFATGTLTNVAVQPNGTLTPVLSTALQLTASGSGNVYVVIWSGSQLIGTNDSVMFDTWIDPNSGAGQINFVCSDGTSYLGAPGADATGSSGKGWWSRSITLPATWNGKTINTFEVAISTGASGDFTTYFRNIRLASAPNNAFFKTSINVQAPYAALMSGMSAANTAVVQTYDPYATLQRLSPAYDLSNTGILKSALLSYVAIVPTNTMFVVSVTSDGGATWQPCTNNALLPLFAPGTNLAGKTLQFKEVFSYPLTSTTTSPDPTVYSTLVSLSLVVSPAAACAKTDVQYAAHLAADWNAGTLTNVSVVNNALTIIGTTVLGTNTIFDNGGIAYYGSGGTTIPVNSNVFSAQLPSSSGSKHFHVQDTGAGTFTNLLFQASIGIASGPFLPSGSGQNLAGITYLSPQFNNTDGTYGYCVMLTSTSTGTPPSDVTHTFVSLLRGSAGGSTTTLQAPIELTGATSGGPGFATIKVIYNVSTHIHKVYSNNILVFTVTDSTYTTGANVGFYGKDIGGASSGITSSVTFGGFQLTYNINGSGTFVSPSTSLSPVANYGTSLVVWNVVTASVLTNLTVEASIDGGSTYVFCANGAPIPGIVAGASLSGKSLVMRVTLLSQVITNIATMSGLRVIVLGQYSASGTRSTIPFGFDTAVRGNVGSGFGTGTDAQTYAQVGTGTTNLTSNKLQIVNTTGDVHMIYGSRSTGDQEATVRFTLSAATIIAGMELRYQDANNYYQFYVSTTTLTLVRRLGGVSTTLATASMAIATGTQYWMRFRVVGISPIFIYGKIWPSGTLEPTAWSVTATDL
jgi:hypothetical protein